MSDRATITNLIDELDWRGFIKDCTDREGLVSHLASGHRRIYAGFDPTSDSLTIGNLVPIMMLAHVRRAGHTPVVVMGGGTGLIGDPSGKSAERQMMTKELVEHNVSKQRAIFENVLGQIDGPDFEIKNNLDWLGSISYIDALRDIGKHFSVNMMMQKESVKERLNNREQGISYTEFSYMILQAYDFAHLYEAEKITVQFGGSDQYGNIVAGCDLIRRYRREFLERMIELYRPAAKAAGADIDLAVFREATKDEADRNPVFADALLSTLNVAWKRYGHVVGISAEDLERLQREIALGDFNCSGLTAPLVKKADGTKFGKTEAGAIWLTAARTSPYAYHQFWLNASDDDARDWIKIFTFLPKDEIEAILARHDEAPGKRELQRALANEATKILHGEAQMENAIAAGKALFSGDIAALDESTLLDVFANIESSTHPIADLDDGADPVEILKAVGLASSNREAKEFLNEGSVSVNGQKIDLETKLTRDHLLHGSIIAIRRGKKNWRLTRWS